MKTKTPSMPDHAILIIDENEGETENVTPERIRTSRTKPQKAKTMIKTRRRRWRNQEDEQVQDVEPKKQNTKKQNWEGNMSQWAGVDT